MSRMFTVPALIAYAVAIGLCVFFCVRRGKKMNLAVRAAKLKFVLEHNSLPSDRIIRQATAGYRRKTVLGAAGILIAALCLAAFILPAPAQPAQPAQSAAMRTVAAEAVPVAETKAETSAETETEAAPAEKTETEAPALTRAETDRAIYDGVAARLAEDDRQSFMKNNILPWSIAAALAIILFIVAVCRKKKSVYFWGLAMAVLLIVTFVTLGNAPTPADIGTDRMLLAVQNAVTEKRMEEAGACARVLLADHIGEWNKRAWLLNVSALEQVYDAGKTERTLIPQGKSKNDLFKLALTVFRSNDFAYADACWTALLEDSRGKDGDFGEVCGSYTAEETLNNRALARLQLGRNDEALEDMRLIFAGDKAEPRFVINLLVAAEACGVPMKDILEETGAKAVLTDWAKTQEGMVPGDYLKTRLAVAYNLAWSDMELPEEEAGKAVTAGSLVYPESDSAYMKEKTFGNRKAVLDAEGELLTGLQNENETAYGEPDPDVADLLVWLDELKNGGVPEPVPAGETP